MRLVRRTVSSVVVLAVAGPLVACNDGTAGDPPTLAELPGRIAAAQEAQDPMIVLGCPPDHWSDEVWDFEGTADRSTAEDAAEVVLTGEIWEASRLPDGDREARFDHMFRLGGGLLLPVLVDGEVKVLLGYDRQGPDVWSIAGPVVCRRAP